MCHAGGIKDVNIFVILRDSQLYFDDSKDFGVNICEVNPAEVYFVSIVL